MQALAELRKLAHALDVDMSRLDMLADLPAADLRALRTQIGEALFQADKHYFVRVAALSKAVPGALAAKLTELVLPPLIAARTAELLEPARAADLVGRISPRYLANVSACMDAARAPEVIAAIPAERVGNVAAELARREEWVVIGSFVAQVSSGALRASVERFDGEQLLRIGFVLDDMSRLDEVGDVLTDAQLDGMLAAAAAHELWAELSAVLENLTGERSERLARRYGEADEAVRARFSEAAETGALDGAALSKLCSER